MHVWVLDRLLCESNFEMIWFFMLGVEMMRRNMANQRCVYNAALYLIWFTFWTTEEEEEEEIAPPQPVGETQTEIPDQKVEEEGTSQIVMMQNSACRVFIIVSVNQSIIFHITLYQWAVGILS